MTSESCGEKKKKGPERRNDPPIFPPFVAEETIPLPAVLWSLPAPLSIRL